MISPLRCVRIPPGPGVRTIAKVPLRRGEGDTEFRLNGERIRLRDLERLLSGTGLTQNGYAVVVQNDIDGIIESTPAQRRALVEEAAGVRALRAACGLLVLEHSDEFFLTPLQLKNSLLESRQLFLERTFGPGTRLPLFGLEPLLLAIVGTKPSLRFWMRLTCNQTGSLRSSTFLKIVVIVSWMEF